MNAEPASERGRPDPDTPPQQAPALSPSEESLLIETTQPDDRITQVEPRGTSFSLPAVTSIGMFLLASGYTLYFAKPLILPIVLGVLLNFLFSPLVRWLHRWWIPRPLAAAVLLLALLGLVFGGIYFLGQPAAQFISRVPERLPVVEQKLRDVIRPMQQVTETARQVEEATAPDDDQAPSVMIRGPGLLEVAFGYAQSLGAGALVTLILLMFLLSMDQMFLHKLVRVLPTFKDKRLAVEIFRQIEHDVSRYLLTVTIINCLLGVATGVALALLQVPNPALWGVMVALLNYIPYLGAGVAVVVLTFVGIVSFDDLGWMLAPPLVFMGLNMVEAYVATPLTLGNRLNLNPVVIFLSLAFWSFIWGVPGMLLSVPMLVVLKLFADHLEPLQPLSEFLAGEE